MNNHSNAGLRTGPRLVGTIGTTALSILIPVLALVVELPAYDGVVAPTAYGVQSASVHAAAPSDESARTAPVLTFDQLLDEMCDADALARFPEPVFRQMQASSYNRKSVSRDQPEQDTRGWFADSDGDQWSVLNLTRGWWGEGDEKIYVDDAYDVSKFPNHFGTGTEDYYGWAGGVNPTKQDKFDHPYLANISVGSTAHDSTLGFNICNRIRGLDAIVFNTRLRFDMEASPGTGQRNPWDLLGYTAVTWWYAIPGARLQPSCPTGRSG